MRKENYALLITLFVFIATSHNGVFGQSNKDLYRAEQYFKIKNYDAALPLYLNVIESGDNTPVNHYRLGFCYYSQPILDVRVKGIPYLKFSIDSKGKGVSPTAAFELGELYHMKGEIDQALKYFNDYRESVGGNKVELAKTDRLINQCKNAKFFLQAPQKVSVQAFGGNVNSEYTEYNPVVSADESVMAFTALRKDSRTGSLVEQVMISYNETGSWSEPTEVNLKASGNIGTAGLSPDGQSMMVFIGGTGGTGNLYTVQRNGNQWMTPVTLGNVINSKLLETTASITPDGKTIYFASNRPGGYGGMDLYKSEKSASGEWQKPVNLGDKVNSKYDEDAPFIHPDQKTLFFTSDGHNTIGGRDIFKARLVNGQWSRPDNLGFPVNTTANDNYFTLTADGSRGYFSSDRSGGKGGQDIYRVEMPGDEANIPLTLLKGRILNGETMRPLPTKIYLIDNETHQKLDFVYQPNSATGDYLIILPPSKNYDMVIECKDFLPYTLNINIPNQTYFYELYQMIYLKAIKQFDTVVGQEVEVRNAFYDTNQDATADLRKAHEAALLQSDSIDVYELMADLIAADDQEAVDYIMELMNMANPIDNVNFDENKNNNLEAAERIYYYDESDESKFEKKIIDGREILSLPTFYVTETAKEQKARRSESSAIDKTLLNISAKLYFGVGKSDLDPKYHKDLDNILKILKENEGLGVEIAGYASSEGDETLNRNLSNSRAMSVLEYLNHRGIVRRRIVAKGYGETSVESLSKDESRKVELKIVDLKSMGLY